MTEGEKLLKKGDGGIDKTSPTTKFTVLDPKKTKGTDIVDLWIKVLSEKAEKEEWEAVRAHRPPPETDH
jgi:hypothetical protein